MFSLVLEVGSLHVFIFQLKWGNIGFTSTKRAGGSSCKCEGFFPICPSLQGNMSWMLEGAGHTHPHPETHGWNESATNRDVALKGRDVNR